MPRVMPDGSIVCETVAEALAVQAEMLSRRLPITRTAKASDPPADIEPLLRKLCEAIPIPDRAVQPGRKPAPLRDVIRVAVMKSYLGLSSRKAAAMFCDSPNFNTLLVAIQTPETASTLETLVRITAAALGEPASQDAPDESIKAKLPAARENETLARQVGRNLARLAEKGTEVDFQWPSDKPVALRVAPDFVPCSLRSKEAQIMTHVRKSAGLDIGDASRVLGMTAKEYYQLERGELEPRDDGLWMTWTLALSKSAQVAA